VANSKGTGNRYASIDALEDREKARSSQLGVFLAYTCSVCGLHKSKHRGDKCSKILQQQREAKTQTVKKPEVIF
jgi:hypothetical protein